MALDSLLDSFTEDVFDTYVPPLPPGKYLAHIVDLEGVEGISQKNGKPYEALILTWEVKVPDELLAEIGRETVRIRQNVFVRRTPDGRLDPKQNLQLGRIREALGQNTPGPWTPRMLLTSGWVTVRVSQRTYEDAVFNEIDGVEKN